MHLILSAFTSSPVYLVATTKACENTKRTFN